MAYQPLEELLPKSNFSIYRLVRIASKRALEIAETGANMVNAPTNQKLATTALDEIRAGKVVDLQVSKEFEPKEAKKTK